jgi:hypothetical protein
VLELGSRNTSPAQNRRCTCAPSPLPPPPPRPPLPPLPSLSPPPLPPQVVRLPSRRLGHCFASAADFAPRIWSPADLPVPDGRLRYHPGSAARMPGRARAARIKRGPWSADRLAASLRAVMMQVATTAETVRVRDAALARARRVRVPQLGGRPASVQRLGDPKGDSAVAPEPAADGSPPRCQAV